MCDVKSGCGRNTLSANDVRASVCLSVSCDKNQFLMMNKKKKKMMMDNTPHRDGPGCAHGV